MWLSSRSLPASSSGQTGFLLVSEAPGTPTTGPRAPAGPSAWTGLHDGTAHSLPYLWRNPPHPVSKPAPLPGPRQPSSAPADLAQRTVLAGRAGSVPCGVSAQVSSGREGRGGRRSRLWVVSEPRLPRTSVSFPGAQRPPWERRGSRPRKARPGKERPDRGAPVGPRGGSRMVPCGNNGRCQLSNAIYLVSDMRNKAKAGTPLSSL
uniref:Uncharacterized protein n=1 Tax=Pipistrellus kuhlii TaxID=59472 RepID=A0A7J7U899_PIPKU|nr:hypothetical protein mPipKuh1_009188 [Pipistrellus kuhlii]